MKIITYKDPSGITSISPGALFLECKKIHGPIAIRLRINEEAKFAFWEDTVRGHSIKWEKQHISEKEVVLTDNEGISWTFLPLTLTLFNTIKSQLSPISKKFNTDEEVQAYYITTSFTLQ